MVSPRGRVGVRIRAAACRRRQGPLWQSLLLTGLEPAGGAAPLCLHAASGRLRPVATCGFSSQCLLLPLAAVRHPGGSLHMRRLLSAATSTAVLGLPVSGPVRSSGGAGRGKGVLLVVK